jgi:hypothetical protein
MKKSLALLVLPILAVNVYAQSQLVSMVLITRHGDRAPFMNIKNDHYRWGTAMEQLTPIGMHQEYMLGKKLRKKYVGKGKLLPARYQAKSIYTVSSDTSRTIESAQSLLMGLYPAGVGPALSNGQPALPHLFQPIPIRTLAASDTMILTPFPQYKALLQKYIFNSPAWLKKQAEYQNKFSKWSHILGNPINHLEQVVSLGDTLIVARSHHFPRPKNLSKQDEQQMLALTSWGIAEQFKNKAVAYDMGDKLLKTIVTDLQNSITHKKPYKMYYYSGHDITLLPLMSLIGAPLAQAPGYASHMIFALYRNDNNHYFIKVLYNGNSVKMPIMNAKATLPFIQFQKYVAALKV